MIDRPLPLTRRRFQVRKNSQHERIVGIQLVSAACIIECGWIAFVLFAEQSNAPPQRVAKRIRAIELDRACDGSRRLLKSVRPIRGHLHVQGACVRQGKCK